MKWQPPIPAGAFCSPAAIEINTALPLLGWCYDQVGRDGWLVLNLHAVAGEIGVPYHTVKKWWAALRASAFIADVDERGRGGMRVRMADDWIDWRILSTRETGPKTVPNSKNGTGIVPNMAPNTEKRDKNGTKTGPDQAPNSNAYKVLSRSEEQEREDRDGTARSLLHPAVVAYHQAFPGIRLNQKQAAVISELVGGSADRLECWQEVIQDYELSPQWKPEIIGNLRSRFENKLKTRANGKQPDERPPLPVMQPSRPDNTVPHNEIAARLLANRGKS